MIQTSPPTSQRGLVTAGSLAPHALDAVRRRAHVLMLPYMDRLPPQVDQFRVLPSISSLIGSELLCPPISVVLRWDEMDSTSVPEAPVHEDGDSCAREREVGRAWELAKADTIPESPTVKLPSERQLGAGIPARHASELAAHRVGQGFGAPSSHHGPSLPVGDVR